MKKRQLVVLRCGLLATVAAILFPPYGYDRCITTTTPDTKALMLGVEIQASTNSNPWKYVGHSFILSQPPGDDDLAKLSRQLNEGHLGTVFYQPEIKIAGHVLVTEIAVIALLTACASLPLGRKRD